jgi:hypothetical protein
MVGELGALQKNNENLAVFGMLMELAECGLFAALGCFEPRSVKAKKTWKAGSNHG